MPVRYNAQTAIRAYTPCCASAAGPIGPAVCIPQNIAKYYLCVVKTEMVLRNGYNAFLVFFLSSGIPCLSLNYSCAGGLTIGRCNLPFT
jgi:hypothetical protein